MLKEPQKEKNNYRVEMTVRRLNDCNDCKKKKKVKAQNANREVHNITTKR